MDTPTLERLDGQTALVTGANRGIGAQIAIDLAGLGATVFAGARDPSGLEAAEKESDGQIVPTRLDVMDEEQIEDAVGVAVDGTGRLDILVNNAGIGDWHGSALHTLDAERLDAVLATNVRGPMLMAKHALPHLLEHEGGRIVNLSSGMGQLRDMGGTAPAYRVSKTAINGLTTYLHGEYGMRGLIANSVCPGWVRTDMGGSNAPRPLEKGAETPVWLCRFAAGAPSGLFWRDRKVLDW